MQRLVLAAVLVFIACVSCVKDETVSACRIDTARYEYATAGNSPAMYNDQRDLDSPHKFDSAAKANCWTRVRTR